MKAYQQNLEWLVENGFCKEWNNKPDSSNKDCAYFFKPEDNCGICLYPNGSVKGSWSGILFSWNQCHRPDLVQKIDDFRRTTTGADYEDKSEALDQEITIEMTKLLKDNSIRATTAYANVEQDGRTILQVYIKGKQANEIYGYLQKLPQVFYPS